MKKYWDLYMTVVCFPVGIGFLIYGIASFFGITTIEDGRFSPRINSLFVILMGIIFTNVSFYCRSRLKKYDWEDDFIYLFLMTVPKKIIRKLRFHKQKIKKQLKKDYQDEK
tara:strand:+ start:870 stop:1202 length:333 start_codon:yes stop_codon:yes gene_type:complete